jgi:hypothetical protein
MGKIRFVFVCFGFIGVGNETGKSGSTCGEPQMTGRSVIAPEAPKV